MAITSFYAKFSVYGPKQDLVSFYLLVISMIISIFVVEGATIIMEINEYGRKTCEKWF